MFESLSELVKIFGAIGTTIVLIFGALKTYESAKNLRKPPATAYSELEKRVITLENSDEENRKKLARVQSQLYRVTGALTREVNTVISWYKSGRLEPNPDREVEIVYAIISEIKADMETN